MIVRKLHNFPDANIDRQITELVQSINKLAVDGILIGDGSNITAAVPNTDYVPAISDNAAAYASLSNTGFLVTAPLVMFNSKIMLTAEGGWAVRYINRTGGVSVKGTVVTTSSSYDNAVEKIIVNVPNPIGVIYENGIADGASVWVVTSGIAEVYFIGSTTRGYLARGFVTGDAGYVAGQALSEALPTAPFATDKHFFELGHIQESRTGAGLARCTLHFN